MTEYDSLYLPPHIKLATLSPCNPIGSVHRNNPRARRGEARHGRESNNVTNWALPADDAAPSITTAIRPIDLVHFK
ncbi:hypothetical protein J6590_003570 [Homalodisca vitripennis]|nr:hypothetical protein J6590_003570 [Homalodisca vitripennis]